MSGFTLCKCIERVMATNCLSVYKKTPRHAWKQQKMWKSAAPAKVGGNPC